MINRSILTRFICFLGTILLAGCIQNDKENCPYNLIRSSLSFSYTDALGNDVIEQPDRVSHIDYYIFTSDRKLYSVFRRTSASGYKNIPIDLPSGEITIIAWANQTGAEQLAGNSLPLEEWILRLKQDPVQKTDVQSSRLYHGMIRQQVSVNSRKFTVPLAHRHADLQILLDAENTVPGDTYECEFYSGENAYLFEAGTKRKSSSEGIRKADFLPSGDRNELTAFIRTFRLFPQTDQDAFIQLYRNGVKLGRRMTLEEIKEGISETLYKMPEQNLLLNVHVDRELNVHFSIHLDFDWENGSDEDLPI